MEYQDYKPVTQSIDKVPQKEDNKQLAEDVWKPIHSQYFGVVCLDPTKIVSLIPTKL